MSNQSDLTNHALTTTDDLYALLSIPPSASASDLRSAYRKATLHSHPDKVGNHLPETLERWHALQLANEVLKDAVTRELYDGVRRGREEERLRREALGGRRRDMVEELREREAAAGGVKRKRGEEEMVVGRLAEDGRRRRKEMEERLRREREGAAEEAENIKSSSVPEPPRHQQTATQPTQQPPKPSGPALARSLTLRIIPNALATHALDSERIRALFARFGPVEDVVLRTKPIKVKVEGEKHRRTYITAVIVFQDLEAARRCVRDVPTLRQKAAGEGTEQAELWRAFEHVAWAGGEESEATPAASPSASTRTTRSPTADHSRSGPPAHASTPLPNTTLHGSGVQKKAPNFASFKSTAPAEKGARASALDDGMLERLRRAEERRTEVKRKREEEEGRRAEGVEGAVGAVG
ncbi:hypothetical protein B0A50_03631 [Salinomyces thailandicus]|uniref:J domain-containing protein n=1 Tax=Salinomyces thailandicus TaxID=706561 RepID=A0A4U0U2B6_9PEZI|nr:hypothetical protein B0A50_03631 [Salinomyces thailandica]